MTPRTLDEHQQARVRCAGVREEPGERRYLVDVTRTLMFSVEIVADSAKDAERMAGEMYKGDPRMIDRIAHTEEWDFQATPTGGGI